MPNSLTYKLLPSNNPNHRQEILHNFLQSFYIIFYRAYMIFYEGYRYLSPIRSQYLLQVGSKVSHFLKWGGENTEMWPFWPDPWFFHRKNFIPMIDKWESIGCPNFCLWGYTDACCLGAQISMTPEYYVILVCRSQIIYIITGNSNVIIVIVVTLYHSISRWRQSVLTGCLKD